MPEDINLQPAHALPEFGVLASVMGDGAVGTKSAADQKPDRATSLKSEKKARPNRDASRVRNAPTVRAIPT
jgi:hypothetical protein